MFSKNIKILSLFLILAVVMIGALGAVSAASTSAADGTANATVINDTSSATGSSSSTGSSASVVGNIVTTSTSDSVNVNDGQVINGTLENSAIESGTSLTPTGDVFYYNGTNYVKVNNVQASTTKITVNGSGTYNATVDLTDSLNNLKSGTTYYLNTTLGDNAVAYTTTGTTDAVDHYALINTTNLYIPFNYVAPQIVLNSNSSTITYGDDWTYSGTLLDAKGNGLAYKTITITLDGGSTTVTTDASGAFSINSSYFYGTASGLTSGHNPTPVSTSNYSVVFTYANTAPITASATLNVTKKSLKIVADLNQTTTSYGVPANLTATLYDANGNAFNLTNAITYEALSTTANKYVGNVGTTNENGTTSDIKFGTDATGETNTGNFVAGTYYVTISASNDNYVINKTVLTFTVTSLTTALVPSATTIQTTPSASNTITFTTNTSANKTNATEGTISYVLYNEDGTINQVLTPSATTTSTGGSATIGNLPKGNYTLVATFTPKDSTDYTASTVSIPVVVKSAVTVTTNTSKVTYTYNTTGNTTYVNVTVSGKLNTTLTVYNGNKSLATLAITNGTGIFDFGALGLGAGSYNITFAFLGDDNYNPANSTVVKVTVNPITIGKLYTNTTKTITINLTSDNVIALNLTNATNISQLIDYTGNVQYTVNNVTNNISMTNGVATVPATSLKGLTNGTNKVVFKIDNEVNSTNTVTVTIIANSLNTAIVANNVTTNNATPIVIEGTVTNATEGNVGLVLFDADGKLLATVYADVAADGSFTGTFGNYANGNYTVLMDYVSDSGLSNESTANVTVFVNGTAPTPTPVGNITTVLTLNNFTEVVGAGQNLTGTLTDVNGTPIVGQHIALNLTNPRTGASKIYWVTTDTDGAFQLAINLAIGTYTASASYAGNSYDNVNFTAAGPVDATITVTDNVTPSNKTATILTVEQNFTEVYGAAQNLTGVLTDINGTPIGGQHLVLNLTRVATGQSKIYYRTTDSDGAYQIPIELSVGAYTVQVSYDGTSVYESAATNVTSFTVTAA